MGQCSVLPLHHLHHPSYVLVLVGRVGRRLLRLPDSKSKVKVPEAVKAHILGALIRKSSSTSDNVRMTSDGAASSLLRRSAAGETLLWACSGGGGSASSDTVLTWHIATTVLDELLLPTSDEDHRHHKQQQKRKKASEHRIVATHMSRYCAYLTAWCPELLPEDAEWSTSLYDAVKKDAERVLNRTARKTTTTVAEHHHHLENEKKLVVDLLGEHSRHEVIRNGVRLAKQLAALSTTSPEEEEEEEPESSGEEKKETATCWKLLADFWSETILHIALSDNLKGHSEAIARGGELITLLWAMLFHAGIVHGRTSDGGDNHQQH